MTSALTDRGSTRAWREHRARLLANAGPEPTCWRCGLPIIGEEPHAGHVIDRALGGGDANNTAPEHRDCNLRAHKHRRGDGDAKIFSERPKPKDRFVSVSPPVTDGDDWEGLGPADPAWDRCTWLDELRVVPPDSTWPRLMTSPHPRPRIGLVVSSASSCAGGSASCWPASSRLTPPGR
jgi:hypothetical protein